MPLFTIGMKNTKLIWGVVAVIIVVGVVLFIKFKSNNVAPVVVNSDPLNISYIVSGQTFNLVDGKAEIVIENSNTKNTLAVFGQPVYGDLDKDGDNDAAILLVNNPGGSGTFYYAVLAINNDGKYVATNTMLLGDRIAPQTLEIQDGHALYNFAERKITDPMTTQPSIGKSVWVYYNVKDNTIGEWVKDFEGEMDDQTMVNAYIRANIKTLAPEKPVLGGSWYIVGISVNPINKTGAVIYEDGHIQGTAIFKYITARNGVTISNMNAITVNDKYIHPLKWPPMVTVINSKFVCKIGSTNNQGLEGQTSLIKINGNEYCLNVFDEGAAGSTYTTYTYTKLYGNKTAKIEFVIQSTQCLNYDKPAQDECIQKRANYDLLPIVDILFSNFK